GTEIHHHLTQNGAQPAYFSCLETYLAAVFVNRGVSHDCGCPIAGKFVEELRSFVSSSWSSKFPFDRENVLPQPGNHFALAARACGILGQMSMAIDQARKNRNRPVFDPTDGSRPVYATEIIVVTDFRDPAIVDNDCAIRPTAQCAEIRRVDKEASDAERVSVALHKTAVSMKTSH